MENATPVGEEDFFSYIVQWRTYVSEPTEDSLVFIRDVDKRILGYIIYGKDDKGETTRECITITYKEDKGLYTRSHNR